MSFPLWLLVLECFALIVILIGVAHRHRKRIGGILALSFVGPVFLFTFTYITANFIAIEDGRTLARLSQGILFMVMILAFGRLLKAASNGN